MKEKIKNALKTEYVKFGLGDKAFDGVASFLVKTIKEESEIDGVIKSEDTKNLLKAFQGESDALRNQKAQLEKDFNAYKEKHPETNPNPDPNPNPNPTPDPEEPAYVKEMREQLKKLVDRQNADDEAAKLQATKAKVEAGLKSAGCTNPGILKGVLKGFALQKDETEDAAIERLKGEYNTSFKETFGDGPVPFVGGGGFGDAKEAIKHKNDFLRTQGLLPKEEK